MKIPSINFGAVLGSKKFQIAATAVVSAATASYFTYEAVNERLEEKYRELAETEIHEAKEFYTVLRKDKFESPADAVRELVPEAERPVAPVTAAAAEALTKYQGRSNNEFDPLAPTDHSDLETQLKGAPVEVAVEHVTNVFVDGQPVNPDEWDQEAELEKRRNGQPFVISKEEFNAGELDFDQTTITYYAADDTLVDEREKVIEDVELAVGEDNLKRFGQGSGDNNVLYVRNEKLELDFEILKARGSYAQDRLGFDPDEDNNPLQHSDGRRFRRGHDE